MAACICGVDIPVSEKSGRPRKYCSNACRHRAYRQRRSSRIPDALTDRARWVRYSLEPRGDKIAKVPRQLNGRKASVTDPSHWTTYRNALRSPVGDGLGIVLGEGLGAIDLDDCIEDGVIAPWVLQLLDEYRSEAIFVERSMSGSGIHIFLPLEEGPGRRFRDGGMKVEVYSRGRYIAVTGEPVERTGELDAFGPVSTLLQLRDAHAIHHDQRPGGRDHVPRMPTRAT